MKPVIEVGTVVVSKAGRDAGRYMLVVARPSDEYALVADGRTHRLAKPKLKKLRHLAPKPVSCAELAARIRRGETVQDAQLRAALAQFTVADQPHEEE